MKRKIRKMVLLYIRMHYVSQMQTVKHIMGKFDAVIDDHMDAILDMTLNELANSLVCGDHYFTHKST